MTTLIEGQVIAESVMKNWKADPTVRVGFPDILHYHSWLTAEMAGFSDSFFKSNSDRTTLEHLALHKWSISPKIRQEFKTYQAFKGYCFAVCDGKIKVGSGLQTLFTE